MIKLGQVLFKNSYSLKRNNLIHKNNYENTDSLLSANISTRNNYFEDSRKLDKSPHLSFKGMFFNTQNLYKPVIKTVPKNLANKVFKSLKDISQTQYEEYIKIRDDYMSLLKNSRNFRERYGFPPDFVLNFSDNEKDEILLYLPHRPVLNRFVQKLKSPFVSIYRGVKRFVVPKSAEDINKIKEEDDVAKKFMSLQGLIKSHEIWENGYRKLTGHGKFNERSEFLIPDDILYGKINRRRNKFVDPNKGKYSSNSLMIGNRLISGVIYSYFLGTDAYNTTMRYSNNKEEASAQRKSRVAQEFSRIGLNMYIQNLLFGTFEAAVNRSLPTAMFVSGSTVACSEILGRKLVGKSIMPSNKEKLDSLEEKMASKNGILPAIGRLLTNVKKKESKSLKIITVKENKPFVTTRKANKKLFSEFARQDVKSVTSFKGLPKFDKFFKVDNLIEKDTIANIYKTVNIVDNKIAQRFKDNVMLAVSKSKYYENNSMDIPKSFDELLSNPSLINVPIGQKETVWGRVVKSVLVPVKFVKNICKSLVVGAKKLFYSLSGQNKNLLNKELDKLRNGKDDASLAFQKYCQNRLKTFAWSSSRLTPQEKAERLLIEFKNVKNKDNEDIQGVKNIILWLDKRFSKEGIIVQPDGTLSPEHREKVKEILMESVIRADGQKQLEYDGNALAQANINLSRAITTLFLVTDAYNLTMQYSGDNRKDANKSAKNRAAQEISRIGVSAYMMAFVHNLLAKLCNSSLGGAFTLTAMTSTINDSLSRVVVGVPLTAKTQEQLDDLDKQNASSQNPIKKALAYSIGKKSVLENLKTAKNEITKTPVVSFNDFYLEPMVK